MSFFIWSSLDFYSSTINLLSRVIWPSTDCPVVRGSGNICIKSLVGGKGAPFGITTGVLSHIYSFYWVIYRSLDRKPQFAVVPIWIVVNCLISVVNVVHRLLKHTLYDSKSRHIASGSSFLSLKLSSSSIISWWSSFPMCVFKNSIFSDNFGLRMHPSLS